MILIGSCIQWTLDRENKHRSSGQNKTLTLWRLLGSQIAWGTGGLILWFLSGCGGGGDLSQKTPIDGVNISGKPYYCRGDWHYPQRYYEYNEIGLASWYGPGFHGKPKPSGERFDRNALTAAHRTLPIPSVVKVTNLKNGKSVVLVVDDRGPFTYEGRIIDLSAAAAKLLESYQNGLTMVRVETLPEESRALSRYLARFGPRGKSPDGRTWVQIYWDEIACRHPEVCVEQPLCALDEPFRIASPPKPPRAPSQTLEEALKTISNPSQSELDLKEVVQSVDRSSSVPEKKRPAPTHTSDLPKGVYVKVGHLFLHSENAQLQLSEIGLPGYVRPDIHPSSGQKFYTGFVGPLASEKSAKLVIEELQEKGYRYATMVHR
jgi:rare lipoprotein A